MKKQNITKLSAILLTLVALIAVFAVTASASDAQAEVSSSGSVNRGEEITFTVSINNAEGVQGISVTPEFDENAFELVGGEWILAGGFMSDFSTETGDGVFAFASANNVNGDVLTFTLKAKADAVPSEKTVSAEVIVNVNKVNSSITVNGASVEILCKHTGGTATCTNKAVCELCGQEYGNFKHTYDKTVATEGYLYKAATCTSAAKYFYSCQCGAKGGTTFTQGEALGHSYTEKVAEEYLKSEATCSAKAVYFVSCTTCQAVGTDTFESGEKLAHTYGEEWQSDENGHWQTCSCGEKSDSQAHIPGAEATETTAQSCTVCNYIIKEALGHQHQFGGEWQSDANGHWQACSCGEKADSQAHSFDGGKVTKAATESAEGVKTFTCTVCGATKTESIPKLAPAEKDFTTEIIILVAVLAVAVVVIVVIVIGKKKSPKSPAEAEVKATETEPEIEEAEVEATETDEDTDAADEEAEAEEISENEEVKSDEE